MRLSYRWTSSDPGLSTYEMLTEHMNICPLNDFVTSSSDVKIYKTCELCCEDIDSLNEWQSHRCNTEVDTSEVSSSDDLI